MKEDCGLLCGAKCCKSEDGNDGMLLLPGEEAFYADADWCRIEERPEGKILLCNGICPRENRPFACRIFPLQIRVTDEKRTVGIHPLARSLCPLCDYGMKGMQREFVTAAKTAAKILLSDDALAEALKKETARIDALFSDPLFHLFD